MFKRLLVANRGEIACRIFATARRLGIDCVAVYSDADATAGHVREADVALRLGPAPARESYLAIDRVLAAITESGADAVHPGYGFLAENAAFAEQVASLGVAFVGPPAAAMRTVGDKQHARQVAVGAGIPVVPGAEALETDADFAAAAKKIGYPVLVKAAAGGGGRGMRPVAKPAELADALEAARREAAAAFGDSRLLLERHVAAARHVELQVFADHHGNAVHMATRDCSAQRRHQKILEEAPAPELDPATVEGLQEAALQLTRAVGYAGAGTVEFLVPLTGTDPFYFLEMNARLQVEHPVTEMLVGEDLVEWQLRIASGAPLPQTQEQIRTSGHAFEARLCAEDPADGFRPAPGKVHMLRLPPPEPGVRVDSGIEEGDTVPAEYDSLIAKIVTHGADRAAALAKLRAALGAVRVAGPATNREFLLRLLDMEAVREGGFDTTLVDRMTATADAAPPLPDATLLAAAIAMHDSASGRRRGSAQAPGNVASPFQAADGWRLGAPAPVRTRLRSQGTEFDVAILAEAGGWRLASAKSADGAMHGRVCAPGLVIIADGTQQTPHEVCLFGRRCMVWTPDRSWHLENATPTADSSGDAAGGADFRAPLPGRVLKCHVAAGDPVATGDRLITLEAMKTEHTLRAPGAGTIKALYCADGDTVEEGAELLEFVPEAAS